LYVCTVGDFHSFPSSIVFSFDTYGQNGAIERNPDGYRSARIVRPPFNRPSTLTIGDLYTPNDFRRAYDATGTAGNGSGQKIGVILAGMPVSPEDLALFAKATGTPMLREGTSGPDTVEWRFIGDMKDHARAHRAVKADAEQAAVKAERETRRELAMDVEYAHAMAPGSHLVVWLIPICQGSGCLGAPDAFYYEAAVRAAVQSDVKVVTNSWFFPSYFTYQYIYRNQKNFSVFYDAIAGLLHSAIYEKKPKDQQKKPKDQQTFFFASGDDGPDSGCIHPSTDDPKAPFLCPYIRGDKQTAAKQGDKQTAALFPVESADVVAVGGTRLERTSSSSGPSYYERAWGTDDQVSKKDHPQSSGGGCVLDAKRDKKYRLIDGDQVNSRPLVDNLDHSYYQRPWWQDNLSEHVPDCPFSNARLVPDIAAYGDGINPRHAFVVVDGQGRGQAGTSIAAPLWAGMAADLEQYLANHNKLPMGFMAPGLYRLASIPGLYSRDFHDITVYGRNEHSAGLSVGPGWDAATGLGSPDLAHLEEDWAATDGGLRIHAASASSVPDTGVPGDAVTIIGKEFDPRQAISLSLCAGIQPACEASVSLDTKGSVQSDNQGSFVAKTVIPAQTNTLTGAHFFIQAKVSGVQALATGGTEIKAKTAAYARFNLRPSTPTSMPTNTPKGCPRSWTCQDIGSPHMTGTQVLTTATKSVTWTVQGAGGIGNGADIFHYVWRPLRGDGTARARLIGVTRSGQYESAQESVMLRASSDPDAPYYSAVSNGYDIVSVDYRTGQGQAVQHRELLYHRGPVYFGVRRVGTTFTTYTSDDGARWAPLNGSRKTLAAMGVGSTVEAGLAVASNSTGFLSTATFDHVSVNNGGFVPRPDTCPARWTCQDVGAGWPGTQAPPTAADGITWTVQGAGVIGSTADIFHYVWQSLRGDGTARARVTGATTSGQYEAAQAGVMLRASSDPDAPYYFAYFVPTFQGSIVVVDYRNGQGHTVQRLVDLRFRHAPVYLGVRRAGTIFTTYTSDDGARWAVLATCLIRAVSLPG